MSADGAGAAAATGDGLICFEQVTKVYGQGTGAVRALAGIDLRIGAGEFVALMGPSGSGKSTTLQIMGCLDVPTAGSSFFRGLDTATLGGDDLSLLRRNYLGFVFQGFHLLARTSALENVELPLVYRGISTGKRRIMARTALAAVGLSGVEHHLNDTFDIALRGNKADDIHAKAPRDRRAYLAWVKLFAFDLTGFNNVLGKGLQDRLFAQPKTKHLHTPGQPALLVANAGEDLGQDFWIPPKPWPIVLLMDVVHSKSPHFLQRL